jgi:hypothetical integral membrane protein (TIGR02206 family)
MGSDFESFSQQHYSALLVIGLLAIILIRWGQRSDEPFKSDIGLSLAGVTCATVILDTIVKIYFGTYDYLVDLPLFLCDLVAVLLPFIIAFKQRKWIGILYFWALAGTFQAILTPDLNDGFPSFHFFRYFIGHAGIIITIVYTVVIDRIRITWQDFTNAILYAQVYLVVVHIINSFLHSNYSYTMQKPPGPSILDLLGSWPWYILFGEMLMIFLFILLMIPFMGKQIDERRGVVENQVTK